MFKFAWPYVIFLLPLIWIVNRYFPSKQTHQDKLLRVPFLTRLQAFNQQAASSFMPYSFNRNQFYAVCAWVLLLIACANPQWMGDPLPMRQEGRNVFLAIDLSPSMSIPDLQRGNQFINRLQSVKSVAAQFIEERQGDKLGLILFGSKAYVQTPLTFDRQSVRSMLDDATIGLAGKHTAIGDAIGLAVKKFETENVKSRILILMTDGGNNAGVIDPMDATRMAKENKIKIYTVGIGASQLMVNQGFGTRIVNPSTDLDEALLKNIANQTGGQYFRAEDHAALNTILESINQLELVSSDQKTVRPMTSLFYWPLAASLLFFTLMLFPTSLVKLRS